MSLLNKLVHQLNEVNRLAATIHKAEKSQVPYIRAESVKQFQNVYSAYNQLVSSANSRSLENYSSSEVVVLLAEASYTTEQYEITRKVLDNYFQRVDQKDQFYCRAKLLNGLVIVNEAKSKNGAECVKYRKIALNEMMESLSVATSPENSHRYSFIVHNTSIYVWKIIQPFLREGRAKNFISEMQRVSAALETIDDSDKDWRILYLCATSYCLNDDNQNKLASDMLDKGIEHAEGMLKLVNDEEAIIAQEIHKYSSETEQIISALRQVEERDAAVAKKERLRMLQQMEENEDGGPAAVSEGEPSTLEENPNSPRIPELSGLASGNTYDELRAMMESSQKLQKAADDRLIANQEIKLPKVEHVIRLYMQRVHVNPGDFKKVLGMPALANDLRMKSLVTLQCMLSGCIDKKEFASTLNGLVEAHLKLESLNLSQNETLLDIARIAWTVGFPEVGDKCFEVVEAEKSMSPIIRVKLDLCKAMKSLADLDTDSANSISKQRLSAKDLEGFIVSRRIAVVKILERMINMCVNRLNNLSLLQEVCIVLWKACHPLMQSHLRKHIHTAVQNMSSALEEMSSPLLLLRAQLHYELSKCEEQADFVVKAKNEAVKASLLDYGVVADSDVATAISNIGQDDPPELQLDTRRYLDIYINPMISLLELRSNLYDTPTETEEQVMLFLQQIKESTSKKYQCDLLNKIALMMFTSLNLLPQVSAPAAGASPTKKGILKKKTQNEDPIPEMSLDSIDNVLNGIGMKPVDADGNPAGFEVFTRLTQKRIYIMTSILKNALQHQQIAIMQRAACYILSFKWDPNDIHMIGFVTAQVEISYLLCDSFMKRLSKLWLTREQEMAWLHEVEEAQNAGQTGSVLSGSDPSTPAGGAPITIPPDPRTLGVASSHATEAMLTIKRLINTSLSKGINLAASVKDDYGVHNGIIYFWNLHLHIFRNKSYYALVSPETSEFMVTTCKMMETYFAPPPPPGSKDAPINVARNFNAMKLDEKLRCNMLETLALLYESQQKLPLALETAIRGCSFPGVAAGGSLQSGTGRNLSTNSSMDIYNRRKLVELASVLSCSGSNSSKFGDPPKFDHPLMNVYALITQAELPQATKEQIGTVVGKAVTLLTGEVESWLSSVDWVNLTKEYFDETIEMQIECWTRVSILKLGLNDIHGAQECAKNCLNIIEVLDPEDEEATEKNPLPVERRMSENDHRKLSARVWRWVCVCERNYGTVITRVIEEDGQEKQLQNELRIASLSHFAASSQYAVKANNSELIVNSCVQAWNVCTKLINESEPKIRKELFKFVRQILDCLLTIKDLPEEDNEQYEDTDEGPPPKESSTASERKLAGLVGSLKQQFYLGMIDMYAQEKRWDIASKVVMEAFQHVAVLLQKPLWKWRVIVMSKRGKSVLDGIQKLKDGNPALQARIYAILARSASLPKQQLEAYKKTVEILHDSIERVDYILETCQWMASASIPKTEIYEVLQSVLDAIFEIEETELDPDDEVDNELQSEVFTSKNGSKASKSIGGSSVGGKKPKSISARSTGSKKTGTTRSRKSGAGSIASFDPTDESKYSNKLNIKYQEQTIRALIMLAMLESQSNKRLARCLEAMYFLEKSKATINSVMMDTYKYISYYRLPPADRDVTPYETFTCNYPAHILNISIEDPVALLCWLPVAPPSTEAGNVSASVSAGLVNETYNVAKDRHPTNVISDSTIESLSLTLHYLLWCGNYLYSHGYCKMALNCFAWCRYMLLYVSPVEGTNAALLYIHFRCVVILSECGLANLISKLPTTLGLSGISISSFLSNFEIKEAATGGNAATDSQCANQDIDGDINASEGLCIFGIASFTPSLSNKLDVYNYIIDTCYQLLTLGQISVCQSLIMTLSNGIQNSALAGSRDANIARTRLRISGFVAYLSFINGQFENSMCLILKNKYYMYLAGDSDLLGRHMCLLAKSYVLKNQVDEAKAVLNKTLDILYENAEIVLNTKMNNGTDIGATLNSSTLTKGAGVPTVGGLGSSTIGGQIVSASSAATRLPSGVKHVEYSADVVATIVEVHLVQFSINVNEAHQYIDSCVSGGRQNSQAVKDVRVLVQQLSQQFQDLLAIVMSVHGYEASLTAKVYFYYSIMIKHLIDEINGKISHTIQPLESYFPWLIGAYQFCVDVLERSVNIYNGLHSNIPHAEKGFTVDVSRQANVGDVTAESVPATFSYTPLSVPLGIFVGFIQLELCSQYMNLAQLCNEHMSIKVMISLGHEKTPVDIYLEQTRQAVPFNKADFYAPYLFNAIQQSTNAINMLCQNTGSGVGAIPVEGEVPSSKNCCCYDLYSKLFYLTCELWRLAGSGEFDAAWFTMSPDGNVEGGQGEEVDPEGESKSEVSGSGSNVQSGEIFADGGVIPTLAKFSPATKAIVNRLEAIVTAAIKKYNYNVTNSSLNTALAGAVQVLIECYGNNNEKATQSAYWLMFLQSLKAREQLYTQWVNSLDKNSDVSVAINRLNSLANGTQPTVHQISSGSGISVGSGNNAVNFDHFFHVMPTMTSVTMRQIEVETAFLSSNSVAWRRLDITYSDIGNILLHPLISRSHGNNGNVVMCLSMCPREKIVYMCVGLPGNDRPETASTASLEEGAMPGPWFVDKLILSEAMRRTLQNIKKRHAIWVEETAKYTATFDDSMHPEFDVECVDVISGRSSTFPIATTTDNGGPINVDSNLIKMEHKLEEQYKSIVEDMHGLFQPLFGNEHSGMLGFLKNRGVDISTMGIMLPNDKVEKEEKGNKSEAPASERMKPSLLMMIDVSLQELPWEGLSFTSQVFQKRVAREFSVHMLGHRLNNTSVVKKQGGLSGAGAAIASLTGKDAASAIAANKITVGASTVSAIVDPFKDDEGVARDGFSRSCMKDVLASLSRVDESDKKSHSVASSWANVCSNGKIGSLSMTDWIALSDPSVSAVMSTMGNTHATATGKPNSLIIYTPGKLSSILSTKELATMNCEGVPFAYVNNLGHNDMSSRRQNSSDNLKDPFEIGLETPLGYAALLSLCGVNCISLPVWSIPLNNMERHMRTFWKHFGIHERGVDKNVLESMADCPIETMPPNRYEVAARDMTARSTIATSRVPMSSRGPLSSRGPMSARHSEISPRPPSRAARGTKIDVKSTAMVVKPWLRNSRITYGLFNYVYDEKG